MFNLLGNLFYTSQEWRAISVHARENVRVKSVRAQKDIKGDSDSLIKSNWLILVDFNGTLISFGVSGSWIQKFDHLK